MKLRATCLTYDPLLLRNSLRMVLWWQIM